MSGRFLTDLADVVRAAGLPVVEEPGWQSRARSSGGYASGRPTHVMTHHTASPPSSDGQPDVDYITYGSPDRPLANLYLNRAGVVWVIAAGATNTNGTGHDSWGGGVPDDSMNTYAVGIEAGNDGTGEPWPTVQQDAYQTLCRALCDRYAIPTHHVRQHSEWAPGRKVDPAGPSRWATSGTWDGDRYRADLADVGPPPAPAGLIAEMEVSMIYFVSPNNEPNPSLWASNVATKWLVKGQTMRDQLMAVQELRLVACGMDPATARGFSKVFLVDEGTFRAYGLAVGPDGDLAGRDQFGWSD